MSAITSTSGSPVTLLVALAAFGSIVQTQRLRKAEVREQRVLAFRRALKELWDNIQHLRGWGQLEERPSGRWQVAALTFTETNNLVAAVWVPSKLWYRIQSVIRNVQAYAIRIDDSATGRGGPNDLR